MTNVSKCKNRDLGPSLKRLMSRVLATEISDVIYNANMSGSLFTESGKTLLPFQQNSNSLSMAHKYPEVYKKLSHFHNIPEPAKMVKLKIEQHSDTKVTLSISDVTDIMPM